mgnify:CR=1 FL=1
MTLSRFLRDYLYIPLGGNRHGPLLQYLSVMLVMLLGGLWHGAAWNFVLWGGLHGVFIVVNHLFRSAIVRFGQPFPPFQAPLVGWAITFVAITIAWVPFRAADFEATLLIWRTMCGLENLYLPILFGSVFGAEGVFTIPGALFDNASFHGVLQAFGFLGGFPILPLAGVICFLCPTTQEWLVPVSTTTTRASINDRIARKLRSICVWRPNAVWAIVLCGLGFLALAQNKHPQVFVYFQF